ncbi:MAG: DUF1638 domain-containing protein [Eubacteriales bacterium]|nr:DUF1638 domain-containing protein [Eubacteriales bacterium]
MSEVVVACSMLENEINHILQAENLHYEIHWVERGLHQSPELLNRELQKIIGSLEKNFDTILLCYGLCGNALRNLHSTSARIVAMRVDDCIQMLLKGGEKDCRCVYLTAGWIDSDKSLENERAAFAAKHGEAKCRRVYKTIFKEYRGLKLLDTGAYDVERYRERTKSLADTLELEYGEQTGSAEVLRKLLIHDWDKDIVIAEPGEPLRFDG